MMLLLLRLKEGLISQPELAKFSSWFPFLGTIYSTNDMPILTRLFVFKSSPNLNISLTITCLNQEYFSSLIVCVNIYNSQTFH